jgi:hypothetical protein
LRCEKVVCVEESKLRQLRVEERRLRREAKFSVSLGRVAGLEW